MTPPAACPAIPFSTSPLTVRHLRLGRRPALALGQAFAVLVIASHAAAVAGPRAEGAGGGVAIHTTGVQRMSVQRQIDLAGTLLSPDQARVKPWKRPDSSRAAEIGRGVGVGVLLVVSSSARKPKLRSRRGRAAPDPRLGMNGPVEAADVLLQGGGLGEHCHGQPRPRARQGQRAKARSPRGATSSEGPAGGGTKGQSSRGESRGGPRRSARPRPNSRDSMRAAGPGSRSAARRRRTVLRPRRRVLQAAGPGWRGHAAGQRTVVATIVKISLLEAPDGRAGTARGGRAGGTAQFRVEQVFADGGVAGQAVASPRWTRRCGRSRSRCSSTATGDRRQLKPWVLAKGVILTPCRWRALAAPDTAVSVVWASRRCT